MVIGIFGESCTGKSTIANEIAKRLGATIYSGKDYIRLAKNENEAKKQFIKLLQQNINSDQNIIYVISEREHLDFLPPQSIRILVTASLDIIKERFAKRTNGKLSPPIALMLEKKHGCFDNEKNDLHIVNQNNLDESCDRIIELYQSITEALQG